MTETIQVGDMLERMARREKVLLDQASSLARHMSHKPIDLNVIHVITASAEDEIYPIEIAFVSGREREASVVFSCIICPPSSWNVQLKQIADAGLSISIEAASAGIDPSLAASTLRNLGGKGIVYVLSEVERKALSRLPLEGVSIKTIHEEWPDLFPKNESIVPPLGRGGPDAVWIYRTMRQKINGDKK